LERHVRGALDVVVYAFIPLPSPSSSFPLPPIFCLRNFREYALEGLSVNEDKLNKYVHESLMTVTALNPHIGYDKAAKIAMKAHHEKSTLREAALALGYLTAEEFDEWLQPEKMV